MQTIADFIQWLSQNIFGSNYIQLIDNLNLGDTWLSQGIESFLKIAPFTIALTIIFTLLYILIKLFIRIFKF